MKKLRIRLSEAGEKTAFIKTTQGEKSTIDYTKDQELKDLADNQDIAAIKTAGGKDIKGNLEEEVQKYTTEEAGAVGYEVAKSLVKVLRAQGNELTNLRLTGVGVNKFNIHVEYGQDKGQDTFQFILSPQLKSIALDSAQGPVELCDFVITQGNEVSLPTPQLEDKLADAMVKYVSSPSDEEYDDMAANELPGDESQINKNIAEGDGKAEYFKPYIVKDTNNPNFLRVFIKYPEGDGQLTALGQRTMSGQDRDFGAQKAMKIGQAVVAKLQAQYNIEDIDISDNEAGKVIVFAVSDDFVKNINEANSEEDLDLIRKFITMAETEPTKFDRLHKQAKVQADTTSDIELKHILSLMDKASAYYLQSMTNQDRFDADREGMYEDLDAVGKEDDDINNDGKVNSTDKYLGKRRDAIAKNIGEDLDVGHQDDEPAMLKSDVYRIAKMAAMLYKELDKFDGTQEVDFPHWWQAKIIKAYDYLQAAYGFLDGQNKVAQLDSTGVLALQEKKGTCCHKCGHTHVKGTAHPTPYNTGKSNCKYRD